MSKGTFVNTRKVTILEQRLVCLLVRVDDSIIPKEKDIFRAICLIHFPLISNTNQHMLCVKLG